MIEQKVRDHSWTMHHLLTVCFITVKALFFFLYDIINYTTSFYVDILLHLRANDIWNNDKKYDKKLLVLQRCQLHSNPMYFHWLSKVSRL